MGLFRPRPRLTEQDLELCQSRRKASGAKGTLARRHWLGASGTWGTALILSLLPTLQYGLGLPRAQAACGMLPEVPAPIKPDHSTLKAELFALSILHHPLPAAVLFPLLQQLLIAYTGNLYVLFFKKEAVEATI